MKKMFKQSATLNVQTRIKMFKIIDLHSMLNLNVLTDEDA